MPYAVRKSGSKYKVVNKNTGKVYGTHDSQEKANKQLAALHIHTHESKIIVRLKQELFLESNGCISVIPEGATIFVDRYSALGMEPPNPETMCKGQCEGTGYIPTYNPEFIDNNKDHCSPVDKTPLSPTLLALWNASEQENPTDDGWHFVECPDCKGAGKIEIASDMTSYPASENGINTCPHCGGGWTIKNRGRDQTIGGCDNYHYWNRKTGELLQSGIKSESKVVSETIMDKAFDSFNDRFPPIAKDGYYEINSPMDDFVVYLVENHGWYINRHRAADPTLPSSGYTWLVHKTYPGSKLVISNLGNNKIKVEEKKL